jgi:HTH-type transcriptional regulator/antitoxin HipB
MEQIARNSKQIGAVLRRQRKKLKLSQQTLGSKTKLRQATLSRLESGDSGAKLKTLLDVLAALRLELVIRPRTTSLPGEIEKLF